MSKYFTPKVRRWIYGVCIALVPVLVYFQLLPADASPVILPLILAILNIDDPDENARKAYQSYQQGTGPIAPNPDYDGGHGR